MDPRPTRTTRHSVAPPASSRYASTASNPRYSGSRRSLPGRPDRRGPDPNGKVLS